VGGAVIGRANLVLAPGAPVSAWMTLVADRSECGLPIAGSQGSAERPRLIEYQVAVTKQVLADDGWLTVATLRKHWIQNKAGPHPLA